VPGRLDLDDPYRREVDAEVLEAAGSWVRLSRTVFHPGGGGQPPDRGVLIGPAGPVPVTGLRVDAAAEVWHQVEPAPAAGDPVRAVLDWPFRYALMRHHGLMHVVNTVARQRFDGVITGVQLGAERSRIDLRLAGFTRDDLPELEVRVRDVIARDLAVTATRIPEAEYHRRPELVRTLNVRPPVVDGEVRVVEIAGFDAQACGGTHVHRTAEIGRARLARLDNKGKDNKRLYWELDP
jgi:misacylated tRNA(Ala) deacylase